MSPLKGLLQKPYSSAYPLSFKKRISFSCPSRPVTEKKVITKVKKDAAKVQIRESKKGDGAVFTRKITYAAAIIYNERDDKFGN